MRASEKRKVLYFGLITFVAISILLSACQQSAATAPAPAKAPPSTAQETKPQTQEPKPEVKGAKDASKAQSEPIKLSATWCAQAGAMFPLWIAKDKGIFQEQGLDVNILTVRGSANSMAALNRGDVQFVECAASAFIDTMMQGADATIVASMYSGLPYRLITKPDIKTPQDLKGKVLANSRPGDMTQMLNAQLIKHFNIKPNEIKEVSVGDQPERMAALKAGSVDAITVNPPENVTARNMGFNEIFDLNDLKIPFIYVSILTSNAFVKQNPAAVEKFVAAIIQAMAYARAHQQETTDIIAKYLKLDDKDALKAAYDTYAIQTAAKVPYVSAEAVQGVVDFYANTTSKDARVTDARKMMDNSFVEKLDKSGFIKKAYGE